MKIIRRVFDYKGTPILLSLFAALFIVEGRWQLRKRVQPRWKRAVTNSIVSIPAFGLLRFLFLPLMIKIAKTNVKYRIALHQNKAPHLLKAIATFLLLDYGNYTWHVINHKLPLLWRFHVVHHSDPDLDVTTAIRFHFGEIIGSVFYRGAFVFLSGASPLMVLIYEIAFEGATQFHHSNTKLPFKAEKILNKIIVTPRMHGIHHSVVRRETDSNYAVIFSFWDRLHNTIRLNVPQGDIITGVAAYNNPGELTAGYLLKMPFSKIREEEITGSHKTQASLPQSAGQNRMLE
jgi:sterol desaturase/sphingolipid hydroxylase (fatty acid hydroxylase superfamily)